MTWREWMAARQLLAEETAGNAIRAVERHEDAEFHQSVEALRRVK